MSTTEKALSVGTVSVGSTVASNGRLSCGDSLGRGRVAGIQRARMLAAMVDVVAERGVANVTVAHVVARSGVSRRTFYEVFEDRDDCFLAAFGEAVERVSAIVVRAFECPGSWCARVRAGLVALLECLECDRGTARLLVVESLAGGRGVLEHRQRVLDRLVGVVEQGRTEAKGKPGGPPLLTGEGVVGGVLGVLHARLTQPESGGLVELTGPLMSMIVMPYLGQAAARREIERPVSDRVVGAPVVREDPLRELGMRLTYRTVRVLMAVAEAPGASNRTVAEAADIGDQGQISKLLARLQGLGLVENTGAGPARGEPNAWTLTVKGWEVQRGIANIGA